MSEIQIDHDAAKNVCHARLAQDMHPSSSDRNIARAYLDLHAQLAAERARVGTLESALTNAINKLRPLAHLFEMAQESNESIESVFLERWYSPYDDSKAAFDAIPQLTAILNAQGDNP